MINGMHAIVFSPEAEKVRDFFADVIGLSSVDAGGGWLIFAMPPAELAVHPADGGRHELYLMCDDIHETLAGLRARRRVSAVTWSSSVAGGSARLSIVTCGAAGSTPSRMLAVNAANSASFAVSRPLPRAVSRRCSVAASVRTQTRRTVPPPRSAAQDRHRPASWICWVNGAHSSTGQPFPRISLAVAVIPAYSCTL